MEVSWASFYGWPDFFVGTEPEPATEMRAVKENMRVIRGCSTSFFSGLWVGPILMAVMVVTGSRCMGQATPTGSLLVPAHLDYVAMDGAPGVPGMAGVEDGSLPDAPEPQQQKKPDPDANKPLVAATPAVSPAKTAQMPVAPKFSKYIPAGYAVEQIHGKEKLVMGARDLVSVGNVGDWILSAGWEQIWNSQPNYGTDRGAFGQRLGAAAIRESSEGILTDGVFDVWLHEDPRYFVQGDQFGLMHRAVYAASRVVLTRSSNDGHAQLNFGLWLGQASAVALTNAYYPQQNRDFDDNWHRYVGSLAGSAGGYLFDEFKGDLMKMVHRKRP